MNHAAEKRLLIVEDSDTQALMLQWLLEEKGYIVALARNGAEGLQVAFRTQPDLIISDIMMPVMDGYRMCEEVRRSEVLNPIPVLLLTRMSEASDILRGLEAGADGYVTKPFDNEYLLQKITQLIENPIRFKNRPEDRCVEVPYGDKSYRIGAGRAKTLNVLISTYENVIWQNNELNRVQKELKTINERLEAMVGARTAELKDANEKLTEEVAQHMLAKERLTTAASDLERSNRELEHFAYVASHDLKEPLRVISGSLNLLKKRYWGALDGSGAEFLAFAMDSALRMERMISDLLAFSRVETFSREFESIDMEAALQESLQNLMAAITDSEAVVTNSPLPQVKADRSQIALVFQNLIGNALKFRNGTRPEVHVDARLSGREWVFSVKDNGVGLDPKYKDRLFNLFTRLHGKEYPGSGIGLATCKRIVERHRGRIWVESEVGSGSTFFFSILA